MLAITDLTCSRFLMLLAGAVMCGWSGDAPELSIVVDRPIVVLSGTPTKVVLQAQASGFKPTEVAWIQVPDRINPLRSKGQAAIANQGLTATVTLPTSGVYQFMAQARSGRTTATASAWVQVWDSRTSMSPGKSLGTGPDTTPPTSVRRLSRTPAPFQHPRVFFTNADWKDMQERIRVGKVAQWGMKTLRTQIAASLDAPTSPSGRLAAQLDAWALAGGTGPAPELTALPGGGVLASEAGGNFLSMLLAACAMQWLDHDPAQTHPQVPPPIQARGAYLARLVASSATLMFRANWDRTTDTLASSSTPLALKGLDQPGELVGGTELCELAMAYDLIYDWMTDAQRAATRELLVAAGYGRHSAAASGFDNKGYVNPGISQNGDFVNLDDHSIVVGLAVEGEETSVDAKVMARFCTPSSGARSSRWVKSAPADDTAAWPTATVASVDNLERQIRWIVDWGITPWGMVRSGLSYFGFSGKHMLPATLAFARRGENPFITTNLYQMALHALLVTHPMEAPFTSALGTTSLGWLDHHDSSGFQQRGTVAIMMKYMYPDDPMVDYMWRAYLPTLRNDPLLALWFGVDPTVGVKAQTLAEVAAAKQLPSTLFDPQKGVITMRSGWNDDDISLWFEGGGNDPTTGHMHAERNSFDFYALGRAWSVAPGYHCTIHDLQSGIQVKDPRYVDDPASQGYIGESPSSATNRPGFTGHFPTPPGEFLEVSEDPKHRWVMAAADATLAYSYGFAGGIHSPRRIDTKRSLASLLYPGMLEVLAARSQQVADVFSRPLMVVDSYNTMAYAIRTVLLVRGRRPYVLIVDDIRKDDQPHDWRWSMNCATGFAPGLSPQFVDGSGHSVYSSLEIAPGATVSDAVLLHTIDHGQGRPRLLVRDVGESALATQPVIQLESRPPGQANLPYLSYGIDNNHKDTTPVKVPSNRLQIERKNVVAPGYVVLLFPFRDGEPQPITTWNPKRTKLSITWNGVVSDTIDVDRSQADHRTRLRWQGR